MVSIEILQNINKWYVANKATGASDMVLKTVPFLFLTLDSLYSETRKLPLRSVGGHKIAKITSSYVFTLGILLQSEEYSKLRLILSLL